MRRSPIVIGATIASTVSVVAFQPSAGAVPAPAAATTTTTSTSTSTASATPTLTTTPAVPAATATKAAAAATGRSVATRYGNVQVRAVSANGKITSVQALQLTDADQKSVQTSSEAEPLLKQEALSKQSANIDAISGATYTSAAYAQSLQSALDKLGFKATNGATALQIPS